MALGDLRSAVSAGSKTRAEQGSGTDLFANDSLTRTVHQRIVRVHLHGILDRYRGLSCWNKTVFQSSVSQCHRWKLGGR